MKKLNNWMRNIKPLLFSYWDVFSAKKFGGNSLPVIFCDRALSGATMLRIAREFRTTETVFVSEHSSLKYKREHTVRIMTPHGEIPFAGHPLLGAAAAVADSATTSGLRSHRTDRVTLSLPQRRVEVQVSLSPKYCNCELSLSPAKLYDVKQPNRLLSALGLSPSQLVQKDNLIAADIGISFHLVNCRSRTVINSMMPNWDRLRRYCHDGSSYSDCYCFAHQKAGKVLHVWARCFLGTGGEDSGTGSAAACLASWFAVRNGMHHVEQLIVRQGLPGTRVSIIRLNLDTDPTGSQSVSLNGAAVKLMEGWLSP